MNFIKEIKNRSGIYDSTDKDFEYDKPGTNAYFNIKSKSAKKIDWKSKVKSYLKNDSSFSYKSATYSTRGDFANLLSTNEDSSILIVGDTWGSSLNAFGRLSRRVWVLGGSISNLKFLRERSSQEGTTNLQFIRSDIFHLPFENESFDSIVMMDTLHWIPLIDASRDPLKLQQMMLVELNRVLKKGGSLLLGVDNVDSTRYLLGDKKEQRENSYGIDGYIELLRNSGFQEDSTTFYYPIPNYLLYTYILPLSNIQSLNFIYKELRSNLPIDELMKKTMEAELDMLKKGKAEELQKKISSYFIEAKK